jgi:hypothetical protein
MRATLSKACGAWSRTELAERRARTHVQSSIVPSSNTAADDQGYIKYVRQAKQGQGERAAAAAPNRARPSISAAEDD